MSSSNPSIIVHYVRQSARGRYWRPYEWIMGVVSGMRLFVSQGKYMIREALYCSTVNCRAVKTNASVFLDAAHVLFAMVAKDKIAKEKLKISLKNTERKQ